MSLADSRFGSKDGLVARARIRPVDGSIATTAPRYFFSPWYAARCAAAFSVSSDRAALAGLPAQQVRELAAEQSGVRAATGSGPRPLDAGGAVDEGVEAVAGAYIEACG